MVSISNELCQLSRWTNCGQCHLSGRLFRRCAGSGPSLLSRLSLTLSGRMVHKVQRILSIVSSTNNTGLSSVEEKSPRETGSDLSSSLDGIDAEVDKLRCDYDSVWLLSFRTNTHKPAWTCLAACVYQEQSCLQKKLVSNFELLNIQPCTARASGWNQEA